MDPEILKAAKRIEIGEKKQKDLIAERDRLGKFAILSNMRSDPKEIYELYKSREEVEIAFDSMKKELENDKSYLHITDGIREGCIIQTLKDICHSGWSEKIGCRDPW